MVTDERDKVYKRIRVLFTKGSLGVMVKSAAADHKVAGSNPGSAMTFQTILTLTKTAITS